VNPPSDDAFDVAVLGAGISGLSFAHHSARAGLRTLVLEQAAGPGGCIHTVRAPKGFWLELGAHTLYNSYGALLEIITALGLEDRILRRKKAPYRLLSDDKLRSVPSQLALGELFASAWRIFSERKDGRTVGDYYGRLVGKRNWRRVFAPLLSAVPSQRADDFPAEMLFKQRPRRKDLPRSFTLEGGLTTLIERMVHADGITVQANRGARAITRTERGFLVITNEGASVETRNLVLALPPGTAADLLLPIAPNTSAALARVRTAAIESTGVVIAKRDLSFPRLAGLVPVDDVFFSAVSRDVVPDDRFRALAFHFRAGLSRDERLARIAAVTKTTRASFVHVAEHATSLPSPGLGHADIVRAIDESLAGSRIFITGNYFGGLALEDCVLRSVAESQRLVGVDRR
jgi:protoporphyrinogen oxidase